MVIETEHKVATTQGGYVSGVLASPTDAAKTVAGSRIVLIVHGFGGHRDYCYQKLLAEDLASNQRLHSFRFDFRGCGKSSPVPDPYTQGRGCTNTDFDDFNAVVTEFVVNRGFILGGIVGHSRGSVAMFYWALNQTIVSRLPTLVNVSGRYHSSGFLARVKEREPRIEEIGWETVINTNGGYNKARIPWAELLDVGSVDMSLINQLPKHVHILSIYGLDDHIVPLADADSFAERLKPRHTLRLIPDADHNFYQTMEGEARVNHNPKVVEIVGQWFSSDGERDRFMAHHQYAGVVNRWKEVEGVSNFRDFGAFKTLDGKTVRPDLLYRCANPARATDKGKQTIRQLGIKTIFDLRSHQEVDKMGKLAIDGVECKWVPVFKDHDMSPAGLAKRAEKYGDPIEGYQKAYREILQHGHKSYRQIMLHIRDRPEAGLVVHCTAGKDRTGVICALILLLMNVEPDTIAREYELTTVGLLAEYGPLLQAIHEKRGTNMMNQLTMLGSRYESMRGTIDIINREFGGAYQYFKQYCGFTEVDLAQIVKNLTADGHVGWRWTL